MDGTATTAITFPYFCDGQRKIESLRLLSYGNHRGDSFFFFDLEGPARNQKLSPEMTREI